MSNHNSEHEKTPLYKTKNLTNPIEMKKFHNFDQDSDGDDDKSGAGGTGGASGTGGTGGAGGAGSNSTSVPGNPHGIPTGALPGGGQQTPSDDGPPEGLIDYNEMAENGQFDEALFRDMQILQTMGILSGKKKPNALLVGDAGTGKTQIVEEIARRIATKDPVVSTVMGESVIYELSLSHLVGGKMFVGQLEEALNKIVDFASDPDNNAILFIDEAHQLMSTKDSSSEKISQAIKPALARGKIRVIMATTTAEATTFMKDPAFSRRLSTVSVPELSVEQTEEIVLNARSSFENFHNVVIPDALIPDIVRLGDEYKQYGSHRPDTALTLLDRSMADARIKRATQEEKAKNDPALKQMLQAMPKPIVTQTDVKKSALRLLTGDDSANHDQVKQLQDNLDQYMIGQQEAKDELLNTVKRQKLKLVKQTKPRSFLFAGSTGTGKTEMAKQLADALFGSKDNMIYVNMSEYADNMSLSRITGSSDGYVGSDSKRELPFDKLENNPFQVVLLDEFEKAAKNVQRFFMQALDEGHVQTNRGKDIDFSRTIIIATTNAGAGESNEIQMGFGQQGRRRGQNSSQKEVITRLQTQFDIELINRFEHIVGFTSMTEADYKQILAVKYNKVIKDAIDNRTDLSFSPEHIDIEDADQYDFINELSSKSYSPDLNGRPAEKTIRTYIEDTVINNANNTQFTFA